MGLERATPSSGSDPALGRAYGLLLGAGLNFSRLPHCSPAPDLLEQGSAYTTICCGPAQAVLPLDRVNKLWSERERE